VPKSKSFVAPTYGTPPNPLKVYVGTFNTPLIKVDEPDEDNYTEWDAGDFNSEEEM
jgi:hypothetical protein